MIFHLLKNLKESKILSGSLLVLFSIFLISITTNITEAKDYRKEHPQKGNLCIARFDGTTSEPLYYNCPRPNDSEKKSYCCFLDKCCDFKEFQKQTEKQFKQAQFANYGNVKGAIGSVLKFILLAVFFVISLIVVCCCLTFFLCRKKKLFSGGILNSPLPTQPPGPSPYAPPTNPYTAYQWPPETTPVSTLPLSDNRAPPPPAYPNVSYPPMPTAANGIGVQPPFNPNFK